MNKDLLETPIVKGQVERYLRESYILEHILERLDEVHLIKISKNELLDFIKLNNLDKENRLNNLNNQKTYKGELRQ